MSVSATTPAAIHAAGLSKTYSAGTQAQVMALRGVELRIDRGEFVAIMGPSGSGKSTLMNLIGCLDTPTAGTYECDGIDVSTLDAEQLAALRRDKIGFVFQGFNLLPRMSALENVAMPLGYSQVSAQERLERARATLVSVGLGDRVDHRPTELSGGQQQRVAIARALITRPALLLADEPTGNLDSRASIEIMALFKELNQNGITVVLVTHEPDIAANAARVLTVRDGLLDSDTVTPQPPQNGHIESIWQRPRISIVRRPPLAAKRRNV